LKDDLDYCTDLRGKLPASRSRAASAIPGAARRKKEEDREQEFNI